MNSPHIASQTKNSINEHTRNSKTIYMATAGKMWGEKIIFIHTLICISFIYIYLI